MRATQDDYSRGKASGARREDGKSDPAPRDCSRSSQAN